MLKWENMVDLKNLYEERYAGNMRFLTSRPGVHSVILECISPMLPKAQVLDVGCGAGRLSLMCAKSAAHVIGIDMSLQAINLAKQVSKVSGIDNVHFEVREAGEVPEKKFHIILLSEVIEHLEDPAGTLHRLRNNLNDEGYLVVSCPSFINFRGYIWMILQEIFQLLMSPSDVRQVYPHDMQRWAEDTGFSIERQYGLYYDWAWGKDSMVDLKQRIRLAISDKTAEIEAWNNIPIKFDALDDCLESNLKYHQELLKGWNDKGFLQITQDWSLPVTAPEACEGDKKLFDEMKTYLKDKQIHFSTQSPVNSMGAGIAYLLRKK